MLGSGLGLGFRVNLNPQETQEVGMLVAQLTSSWASDCHPDPLLSQCG
jgi:hypothetical protein